MVGYLVGEEVLQQQRERQLRTHAAGPVTRSRESLNDLDAKWKRGPAAARWAAARQLWAGKFLEEKTSPIRDLKKGPHCGRTMLYAAERAKWAVIWPEQKRKQDSNPGAGTTHVADPGRIGKFLYYSLVGGS